MVLSTILTTKSQRIKNQTVGNTRPYDTCPVRKDSSFVVPATEKETRFSNGACLMFPLEPFGSTGVVIHISEVTVVNKAESISGSE